MNFLLNLLLPALLPALTDGVRGLIGKFTGGTGALPQNVGEAIQLMEAQTARLEALAKLDALSPNVSPWVANLRGSFRYLAVGAIVLTTIVAAFIPELDTAVMLILLELTGASMSFIIGERMYLHLKK